MSPRYPVQYRAGIFMQRHNAIDRWAKSRQTPIPSWSPSQAVRVGVAEGEPIVDIIANGLDACPSRRQTTEKRPGDIRKTVGFAVAAAQQKFQRFDGQILYRDLSGIRFHDIRQTAVADHVATGNGQSIARHDNPRANIPKMVRIGLRRNWWIERHPMRLRQILETARMDAEHQNCGSWRRAAECEVVADPNFHPKPLTRVCTPYGLARKGPALSSRLNPLDRPRFPPRRRGERSPPQIFRG